ncbi:hypothetical protein [Xylophilus sp. Leaf220]|uniref:hypothetical protein n=1 Tax=Xylophilus sp. Leaf220 TaxID=1735686 RepID=UPI0006FE65DF|nr:hypothetical protein [Xylophilus sp. Leaf220]KQM78925.1 hypothetical protein ASE76_16170 [Xylophilus sp. Leaf220]
MNPIAYLLAASIAANAALGWAWIDARDARTVAEQQRDQARADATAASDAVEALEDVAKKRAAAAKPVQAAARAAAVAAQQRATQEIATRAAVAGDDYASVQVRLQRWEQGRAKP